MQITRMNVTPEMAQSWLDAANTGNRTMTRRVVSKYADDMIAGRWIDTHQNAIAFYDDGSLADGQHRLGAVAMQAFRCRCLLRMAWIVAQAA